MECQIEGHPINAWRHAGEAIATGSLRPDHPDRRSTRDARGASSQRNDPHDGRDTRHGSRKPCSGLTLALHLHGVVDSGNLRRKGNTRCALVLCHLSQQTPSSGVAFYKHVKCRREVGRDRFAFGFASASMADSLVGLVLPVPFKNRAGQPFIATCHF
jgi:hypothetical protein